MMKKLKSHFVVAFIFCISAGIFAGSSDFFDGEKPFVAINRIDELQTQNLNRHGLTPAKICSDGVFIRRVWLDLAGTAPSYEDAKEFILDKSPEKRARLIDKVLESDAFAHYWALRWGDILRIKSEFPVNMWPNAVQAYSLWLWDSIRKNKPYDRFARELICSTGSNFRDPPVNFYRSTQDRTPEGLAKIAVLAFLCSRLENWEKYERAEMAKLFSRVSYKKTDEWKEEIVIVNPEPFEKLSVNLPDGTVIEVPGDSDPREAFFDWLVGPGKQWFSEAAVNRVWFWLFGTGIVHEPDDFRLERKGVFLARIAPGMLFPAENTNKGNPPANPELLKYLAEEFIASGYDFKALLRLIANSATYQQSCFPSCDIALAEKYFAVYKVRRLDAEVIADIIAGFSDKKTQYVSVIPEPFTFVPKEQATIELNDGSITSAFLETFGRSPRNSGLLCERDNSTSYSQRLFMLNSSEIQNDVCGSQIVRNIIKKSRFNPQEAIRNIYLLFLSRYPSDQEMKTVSDNFRGAISSMEAFGKNKKKLDEQQRQEAVRKSATAFRLFVWAVVNSEEFIYKH